MNSGEIPEKFGSSVLNNRKPTKSHKSAFPQTPIASDRRIQKGTNGVSTNGVTANFMFFDRGTFLGYQSVNICQSLSFLHTIFPNLSKIITSAATPLVLTPFVRSQRILAFCGGAACIALAGRSGDSATTTTNNNNDYDYYNDNHNNNTYTNANDDNDDDNTNKALHRAPVPYIDYPKYRPNP